MKKKQPLHANSEQEEIQYSFEEAINRHLQTPPIKQSELIKKKPK